MLFAVYNPSFLFVSTHVPEMPYLLLDTLEAQAEVLLVELNPIILDYPSSLLCPTSKLIGGTASGPAKRLPPEFRSFVDSAGQEVDVVPFDAHVL